jgi:transposase
MTKQKRLTKEFEIEAVRRENEVLRQERDILKKATAFFVREGSR